MNFTFLFKKNPSHTGEEASSDRGGGAGGSGGWGGVGGLKCGHPRAPVLGDLMDLLSHVDKVLHSGLTAPLPKLNLYLFLCISVLKKENSVALWSSAASHLLHQEACHMALVLPQQQSSFHPSC